MRQHGYLIFAVGFLLVGCGDEKRAVMSSDLESGAEQINLPSAPSSSGPGRLADDPGPVQNPTGRLADDPLTTRRATPDVASSAAVRPSRPQFTRPSGRGLESGRMSSHMPTPLPPPADKTVTRSYQTALQSVTVEAVCSITESDVNCWDLDGRASPTVEEKVRQAIDKSKSEPYGEGIRIRPGLKNRMLVIRTTQKRALHSPGNDGYLTIQGAGATASGMSGIRLLQDQFDPNVEEYVTYETRMVAEDPNLKETHLRLRQTSTENGTGKIALKSGATTEFRGYKVKIESVEQGASRTGMYVHPGQKSWTVTISHSGPGGRGPNLTFVPIDDLGRHLTMVDWKGNPISMEQHERQTKEQVRQGKMPGNIGLRSALMGMTTMAADKTEMVFHVDPARVASLEIRLRRSETVDIRGIPLDPK